MKNKPSDLEKAFGTILPVIGGCLIIYLLTVVLGQVSRASGGAVIAVTIMGIGFYLFIKPGERKHKPHQSKTKSYSDSRLDDLLMKRIYKAYNLKEEPESKGEDSDDEADKDLDIEEDEVDENAVIYYNHDKDQENWLKTLISPVQLPITIAAAWFIIVIGVYNLSPGIAEAISKSASPSTLVIFPILFLLGLSGFLGILLKQPSESLETTPKEKFDYMLNVFKILAGWGTGIYALWVYLQN